MVVILPNLPPSTWWGRLSRIRRIRVRFLRPTIERKNIHILIIGVVLPWWRYDVYTDSGIWTWGCGWWLWQCRRLFDIEIETRGPNAQRWPVFGDRSPAPSVRVNRPYVPTSGYGSTVNVRPPKGLM
jgi:hypothetical protein